MFLILFLLSSTFAAHNNTTTQQRSQHNNAPNTTQQHNNTTGLPTMPQIYHQPSPFLFLFKPFIRHRFWFSGPRSQTHAAVKSFELQQQKHIFNHCSRFNAISEQLRTLFEGKDDFMDPEVINIFSHFKVYQNSPPPPWPFIKDKTWGQKFVQGPSGPKFCPFWSTAVQLVIYKKISSSSSSSLEDFPWLNLRFVSEAKMWSQLPTHLD